MRKISARFGINSASLNRHRKTHIPAAAASAVARSRSRDADAILAQLHDAFEDVGKARARCGGKPKASLSAAEERVGRLLLQALRVPGVVPAAALTIVHHDTRILALKDLDVDELRALIGRPMAVEMAVKSEPEVLEALPGVGAGEAERLTTRQATHGGDVIDAEFVDRQQQQQPDDH